MKFSKSYYFGVLVTGLIVILVVLVVFKEPIDDWFGLSGTEFQSDGYLLDVAFPNLQFRNPVGLYHANDGSNRLFVVEQAGAIRVFDNSPSVASSNIFLDLSGRVLFGGEQGLLGLAFPADFSQTGHFYISYVADNPRRVIIARYSVSSETGLVDSLSEFVLLEILQPAANHNGGQLAFGPDGKLYISLGDGGPSGDPSNNAQNPQNLLGTILRIDVSSSSNYTIPPDNPFFGNTEGIRQEIYAYGFRNPWRFSFDPPTGRLWVADVGEARIEEINIVEAGGNYGWRLFEGSLSYPPGSNNDPEGLEFPVWEYGHGLGRAVTGGFVYRGSTLQGLVGAYIYGDFISGRIWALRHNGGGETFNEELFDTGLNIASFGIDATGELYICAFDGKIYRVRSTGSTQPVIGTPAQSPQEPLPNQEVTITVNVTATSGLKEVVLSYSNDTAWINTSMTYVGGDAYLATIPGMQNQTIVRYQIIATDNANQVTVADNFGAFYYYTVVPEFSASFLLAPLLIATFIIAIVAAKKSVIPLAVR